MALSTHRLRKDMRAKPRRSSELARVVDQLGTRFDAVDVAVVAGLEKQVVEDEAEVGLPRAMVGQRQAAVAGDQFGKQRLDEVKQVMDLL
jgi:hypothetical protein